MKTKSVIGLAAALGLGLLLWFRGQTEFDPSWEQPTMGTVCRITLAGSFPKSSVAALRSEVESVLAEVNRSMSVWDPDSDISRFNRLRSPEPFPLSPEFARVMQRALHYSAATEGAFDPTVKPLVDYWGFGPEESSSSLEEVMSAVGWQKLRLEGGLLSKRHPGVQLDLGAIAKGYGVDRAAGVIRARGIGDFIVEIGGEIVAQGERAPGKPWRIGIESPLRDRLFGEEIYRVLTVRPATAGEPPSIAMATSGDYRNFRIRPDGTIYSHLIHPFSGDPFESEVASVTVIAASCMDADAVATALCVMGAEAGRLWLEAHPGYEALFILHNGSGPFMEQATGGFPADGASQPGGR